MSTAYDLIDALICYDVWLTLQTTTEERKEKQILFDFPFHTNRACTSDPYT